MWFILDYTGTDVCKYRFMLKHFLYQQNHVAEFSQSEQFIILHDFAHYYYYYYYYYFYCRGINKRYTVHVERLIFT